MSIRKIDGVVVDADTLDGSHLADIVQATRELFIPCLSGTDLYPQVNPFVHAYRIDSEADNAYMSFFVPHDFTTLTALVLLFFHYHAGVFTDRLNFYSYYGALGEDPDIFAETALDIDFNGALESYKYKEYNMSGIVTNLDAGDYVTIKVTGDATNVPNLGVIGARLRYT